MARKPAQAMALGSGILFGLATPASKVLVGDLGPYLLAGLLYLGAALAMLPFLRGKALRPTGQDQGRLFGSILLGGILGPVLLLLGLAMAQASSVSVWLNLELAWTAILGVLLFREASSKWSWLAVALVMLASVAVSSLDVQAGLIPGLLVTAACLCWGLDNHWTAKILSISVPAMTFWKGLVGGAVNIGFGVLLGMALGPLQALAAVAIGTVCYGLSIALYIASARLIGATRAQVMFSTAPLWGILAAVTLLGEPWDWRLGLAVALVAAAIACLAQDSKAKAVGPAGARQAGRSGS